MRKLRKQQQCVTCKFGDGAPAADAEAGDVGGEPLVLHQRPQPFPQLLLLRTARVRSPHLLPGQELSVSLTPIELALTMAYTH